MIVFRFFWIFLISLILLLVFFIPFKRYKSKIILNLFIIMGTTFIKLGQSLSTRPDVIGNNLAETLSKLQDDLKPVSIRYIYRIMEESLDKKINEIFKEFNEKPKSVASIAQVHKAVLLNGKIVAVKVIKPNIQKKILTDIKILTIFSKLLEFFFPKLKRLKSKDVLNEFKIAALEETDLRIEAYNNSCFRENHKGNKIINSPKIFKNLLSKKVMVMEWVSGAKISNVNYLTSNNIDKRKLLINLSEFFFLQIFRDGFFHGDMHPGNVFVNRKGELILLDFGIMGRMTKKTREYIAKALFYVLTNDYFEASRIHFKAGYVPKDMSVEDFEKDLKGVSLDVIEQKNFSMGDFLKKLYSVTEKYNMTTREELILMQKNIVVVEGIVRKIDKDFNMWMEIMPLIKKWFIVNFSLIAKIENLIFKKN